VEIAYKQIKNNVISMEEIITEMIHIVLLNNVENVLVMQNVLPVVKFVVMVLVYHRPVLSVKQMMIAQA
jgi:hypothetical protein